MSKFFLILSVFVLFLFGCRSVNCLCWDNQSNMMKLSVGMSKGEVMDIMGTECVSAFHNTGKGRPPLPAACNPYKTETQSIDGKIYEVLYYVTNQMQDDGAITDDELTPLCLQNDKLIGWGRDFFNQ